MKRYSLIVVLHIIGIAFLSVGVYLLVDAGLWFSTLMAFLILLAIAVHLYRLQMMQVRMMRHLAESLRYDDMMLSFRSPYKNRSMEDMVDELSEAMRNFRTRVLERNEMEAWQKLIRVLTHEIMNSITPIISLSETLSEREVSEKNYPVMRQGMQTIHRRSKGLLEFVENYRKLTRLPAPVRRPVAVHELLQDLQKLFSEEYIRIELPEIDRILQIDRTQIEQVLINLIKNAKEACSRKEHPLIEVKMLFLQEPACYSYASVPSIRSTHVLLIIRKTQRSRPSSRTSAPIPVTWALSMHAGSIGMKSWRYHAAVSRKILPMKPEFR